MLVVLGATDCGGLAKPHTAELRAFSPRAEGAIPQISLKELSGRNDWLADLPGALNAVHSCLALVPNQNAAVFGTTEGPTAGSRTIYMEVGAPPGGREVWCAVTTGAGTLDTASALTEPVSGEALGFSPPYYVRKPADAPGSRKLRFRRVVDDFGFPRGYIAEPVEPLPGK
jgi:hypothetical protein